MQANELIANTHRGQMVTRIIDMPSGYREEMHEHAWHQIIYPVKALFQLRVGA